jgi:hypothetical protein
VFITTEPDRMFINLIVSKIIIIICLFAARRACLSFSNNFANAKKVKGGVSIGMVKS